MRGRDGARPARQRRADGERPRPATWTDCRALLGAIDATLPISSEGCGGTFCDLTVLRRWSVMLITACVTAVVLLAAGFLIVGTDDTDGPDASEGIPPA